MTRALIVIVSLAMACSKSSDAPPARQGSAAPPPSKPTLGAVFSPGMQFATLADVPWAELDYITERGRANPLRSKIELSASSGKLEGGREAAVVVIDEKHGDEIVSYVWVYAAGDGMPVLLDTIDVARQRNVRRIYGASIEDGAIEVERLFCDAASEDDAINCPRQVTVELWRWNGTRFAEDTAARTTRVP